MTDYDRQRRRYERAEAAIRDYLGCYTAPSSATVMMRHLRDEGYRDSDLRAAVWFLIDRGEVELTSDRRVGLRGLPAGENVLQCVGEGDPCDELT